jgi:hypothetical protein
MNNGTSGRDRTLARLGITWEDVSSAPQITPQLRMITGTLRRFGQNKVISRERIIDQDNSTERIERIERIESHSLPYGPGADLLTSWPLYLGSSDHSDARRLLLTYYATHPLFRERPGVPSLPIEAYCVAAGVNPISILGILTAEIVRCGASANAIIAAVNQPRVVQKLVDRALDDGYDKSMEAASLLSKATGFLPSPRGAQTVVNVAANASASTDSKLALVSAPPAEQTIRRMIDRVNESRGLPPAAPDTLPSHMPSEDVIEIPAESDEDDE